MNEKATRREAVFAMTLGALGAWGPSAFAADGLLIDAKDAVEEKLTEVETDIKALQARDLAIEAYIYAYPLVTMELTRRSLTNVAAPEASKAPMGQFLRLRGYPPVEDHAVTAPNADTLYTII